MKALCLRPGQPAEIIEIDNTLQALQAAVGGYIETVTIADDLCLICNEEGRLLGLKESAQICGTQFVGPILFVGINGEEFCGLTDDQITAIKIALLL